MWYTHEGCTAPTRLPSSHEGCIIHEALPRVHLWLFLLCSKCEDFVVKVPGKGQFVIGPAPLINHEYIRRSAQITLSLTAVQCIKGPLPSPSPPPPLPLPSPPLPSPPPSLPLPYLCLPLPLPPKVPESGVEHCAATPGASL